MSKCHKSHTVCIIAIDYLQYNNRETFCIRSYASSPLNRSPSVSLSRSIVFHIVCLLFLLVRSLFCCSLFQFLALPLSRSCFFHYVHRVFMFYFHIFARIAHISFFLFALCVFYYSICSDDDAGWCFFFCLYSPSAAILLGVANLGFWSVWLLRFHFDTFASCVREDLFHTCVDLRYASIRGRNISQIQKIQ